MCIPRIARRGGSSSKPINARVSMACSTIDCARWLLGLALFAIVAHGNLVAMEPQSSLSERIDQLIDAKLSEQGQKPAELCDDVTYLRRVMLDLTGRNPTSGEVVAFMKDSSTDKREKLVDRLLQSPMCATHMANIWSAWLLPEMQNDVGFGQGTLGLQTWLRNRFADNLRYDRLVSDLMVASGQAIEGPASFYLALEGKPEKIAAKTARVFLGVQLDCAECHDHPFDHWKQRDFWGFAAYFAQLSTNGMEQMQRMEVRDVDEGDVKLPGSEEIVSPKPLVATGESGLASGSRRQQLTLWLTARENPYLARAAVNRAWSILFGRGLIEPIDDMRSIEMASHPELLSMLAKEFASGGFDLRALLRSLALTKAYQRVSTSPQVTGDNAAELNSYATMPIKPLTAVQLATCMLQVARDIAGERAQTESLQLASQFGKLRGDHSAATLGIVQALVTLHGERLNKVHASEESRLLQALTAPHLDDRRRIDWMFLCTLCRHPTAQEVEAIEQLRTRELSKSGGSQTDTTWQADLLWALVNSTEFAMTP